MERRWEKNLISIAYPFSTSLLIDCVSFWSVAYFEGGAKGNDPSNNLGGANIVNKKRQFEEIDLRKKVFSFREHMKQN